MSSPATIRKAEECVVETNKQFLDAVTKLQVAIALLRTDLQRTLSDVDTNRQALMDDIDKSKPGSKAYIAENAFKVYEKAKAVLETLQRDASSKSSNSTKKGGKKSKRSVRHQKKSRRNYK